MRSEKSEAFTSKVNFLRGKKKWKKAYYLEVDEDLPDSEDNWLAKNQAQYYERKSCRSVAPQIQKGKCQIIGNRNAELGGEKKRKRSPSVQHPDALYSIYRCYICSCWFYPWKLWWIAASSIANLIISVFFRSYCIGQASILDGLLDGKWIGRRANRLEHLCPVYSFQNRLFSTDFILVVFIQQ